MKRKLIEDWLPIEQIAEVMSERRTKGEPAGIHQWWGTRPSALARAVLFASLVDSPDDDGRRVFWMKACREMALVRMATGKFANSWRGARLAIDTCAGFAHEPCDVRVG